MRRFIFLSLSFFVFTQLSAFTLKDQLLCGKKGDFAVMRQSNQETLLLIREITTETLELDEITIAMKPSTPWNAWLEQGAPNHTAWTSYEIDLETMRLSECYSHAKKGWLSIKDPTQILPSLLSLPLNKTADSDRKRIGPPPQAGEPDHRPLWIPPLISEGKKVSNITTTPYYGTWPKDQSDLSQARVDLYFTSGETPFPTWIEIQSTHYGAKIQTIDTGSIDLAKVSLPQTPKRPTLFVGTFKQEEDALYLPLQSVHPKKKIKLFAVESETHLLPSELISENGGFAVKLPMADLKKILDKNSSYRLVAVEEEGNSFLFEFPTKYTLP